MSKGTCDVVGGGPSPYLTSLPSMVGISLVEIEK